MGFSPEEVEMKRMTIMIIFVMAAGLFVGQAEVSAKEQSGKNWLQAKREYNEYLLKAIQDRNLGIRFSAIKLLGERRVYQATDQLVELMKKDPDYQVRIAAALALLKIGDKAVIHEIKKQAQHDKNKTVRHVLSGVYLEMSQDSLLTTRE